MWDDLCSVIYNKSMTKLKPNLGGRPTKLNDEMVEKAQWYLDNHKELGDLVPTVVGMALHLDVATNTIYNWAGRDNPKFLRLFIRVEQIQHQALVNGGLAGHYNPAITKMMLTKHGYSDKQEIDHRSPDGTMSPTGKSLDDFYKDVPAKPRPS